MIDSVMVNIGAAVMLIGGVALVAIVLGLAVYAAGLAWIAASNRPDGKDGGGGAGEVCGA